MSEHIEHNLSRDLLARMQEKKLSEEGWSKQKCMACAGQGVVQYGGRPCQCPSCKGAGVKWRQGVVIRGGRG